MNVTFAVRKYRDHWRQKVRGKKLRHKGAVILLGKNAAQIDVHISERDTNQACSGFYRFNCRT